MKIHKANPSVQSIEDVGSKLFNLSVEKGMWSLGMLRRTSDTISGTTDGQYFEQEHRKREVLRSVSKFQRD